MSFTVCFHPCHQKRFFTPRTVQYFQNLVNHRCRHDITRILHVQDAMQQGGLAEEDGVMRSGVHLQIAEIFFLPLLKLRHVHCLYLRFFNFG